MFLAGGETEDLIQEGMIGLFQAVRDYQPDKNTLFSTFANLCVVRQLCKAIEVSGRKKHKPLNAYVSLSGDDSPPVSYTHLGTILMVCHEPEFYEGLVSKVWDCSEWTTKIG